MFDGSTSKVIGIMDPIYVADQTIEAILLNKKIVYLPKSFGQMYFWTVISPKKVVDMFHKMTFGGDMMNSFKGRPDGDGQQF